MASVYRKNNRHVVQLSPTEHPDRPSFFLHKKADEVEAGTFKANIEALIRYNSKGRALPVTILNWLDGLEDRLVDRLGKLGIIEPRAKKQAENWTVSGWVEHYISSRPDVKKATQRKYRDVEAKLKAFFADDLLSGVTVRTAKRFRVYLKEAVRLKENTIRRHIGITRQFFNAAIEAEIISKNPFRGQSVSVRANESRSFYVTPEIAQKVLEACPDAEWRLIFGLARFGGLRCPSEVIRLKWQDVDFEHERFTVHSDKTEHHESGGVRVVPMFGELKPLFRDAFEQAPDGAVYCVHHCGGKWSNLSTTMRKIIKRAGLKPWEKLFVNCRSTRLTELIRQTGNLKAVCSWLGHSEAIALKHYAQITDADMKAAVTRSVLDQAETLAESGLQNGLHFGLHTGAEKECKERQEGKAQKAVSHCNNRSKQEFAGACGNSQKPENWAILDLNQ